MTKSVIDQLRDTLGNTASTSFEVTHFLGTGFQPLNQIVSGWYNRGLPSGRLIEMFGPSMCGKTAIATAVMATCINADGFAMFNDHERSFDITQARALGVDDESGRFAHVRPKTCEESFMRILNTARKIRENELIPARAPIVAVVDSIAAMVPKSKVEKELDEMTMADKVALAQTLSTVLPVVKHQAEEHNILVLVLNQLREKPGVVYGDPQYTPGGKTLPYLADVRIKLTAAALKDDATKERLGQRITAECIKTKLTRPFQKTTWDYLFTDDGRGRFDVVGSLIDHLKERELITLDGTRMVWDGKKYTRGQLIELVEKNNLLPEFQALCRDPE